MKRNREDIVNDMLLLHNIKQTTNGYMIEQNYTYDKINDKVIPKIKLKDSYKHYCPNCSHFTMINTNGDGCCDIYNKLMKEKQNIQDENIIFYTSNIINCDAYDEVKNLNYISSEKEMISFISHVENFFPSQEDFEDYFKFSRKWNEDTGEILETVEEYYKRGGTFKNIPNQYPCVIWFDLNCDKNLQWISIPY